MKKNHTDGSSVEVGFVTFGVLEFLKLIKTVVILVVYDW